MAIADIALRKPTLDDVFLRLTGHGAEIATEPADGSAHGEAGWAHGEAGGPTAKRYAAARRSWGHGRPAKAKAKERLRHGPETLAYGPLDRLRWAARDGLLIAGRDVAHWVRSPS